MSFEDQVTTLIELGYPALAGLSERAFRAEIAPLAEMAGRLDEAEPKDEPGRTAYVIVVTRELVDPITTVPLLRLVGGRRPGVVDRNHAEGDLATYDPLPELKVPEVRAYLLVDIERGEEFCGVRPQEALPVIRGRGRTPLTIDEGIAVVTQAPHLLEKNKCFMLSGSRRSDRRVPALWISERAPKLGWCWDGNPHTWLGVASAGERIA
ncbi:hypothetical protein JNB_01290 [Janibacter sp. HTCC2649]|uniref:DUF5701 family protein n=1 Tax=Janibacter sp. HTCC2649 TaxID=313589 RepID=UPI000066ECDE|nr:DUF5701 family protein [Janibacter sp. HTCC2649]EAP98760.1 hypothetical protein JNB_01290 [Janibacter sp. HTCC2649]